MNEKLFDGFGYKKIKKLSYKLPNNLITDIALGLQNELFYR